MCFPLLGSCICGRAKQQSLIEPHLIVSEKRKFIWLPSLAWWLN